MSTKNRITRRSAFALGGAAMAAAGLAACGGNTGGLTGGGGSDGGGGALSQWYHQYGEEGTQQAANSYAADYPDAKVTVNWVTGDYATKLSTALLSGGGVDVFENNGIAVDQAEQGRYVDLTDIMEPAKGSFNEASLGPVTIGDKIWGVPMIVDPQHFYYRKSLFEAAGIEVPTTWEDLVAAWVLTVTLQRCRFSHAVQGPPCTTTARGSPLDRPHLTLRVDRAEQLAPPRRPTKRWTR